MKLETKEQKLRDTLGLMIPYTEEEIELLEQDNESLNQPNSEACNE